MRYRPDPVQLRMVDLMGVDLLRMASLMCSVMAATMMVVVLSAPLIASAVLGGP